MVTDLEQNLLLKRIADIKADITDRSAMIEKEKATFGVFYAMQMNRLKEICDRIEKVEDNFDRLCKTNTYNEIDGTITAIRMELNF